MYYRVFIFAKKKVQKMKQRKKTASIMTIAEAVHTMLVQI